MRKPMPSLTPAAELAMLRQKYPDGLYCTSPEACPHRLLATTAAGWAKSWAELPQHERLARRDTYVCAECRQAAADRERMAAVRAERASIAGTASARARAERRVVRDAELGPSSGLEKSTGSNTVFHVGRAGRSGRPRVAATVQRQKNAARCRVYRDRKKREQIAANEAALARVAA
jgi:hypothetical protein